MKKPGEQRKNSFEHEDLEQVLAEIEEFEDQQEANRARVRGENSALAKKIQAAKKRATKELKIPRFILDGALATKAEVKKKRAADERMQEIAAGMPSDGVELWADAVGQFSFLQPEEDEQKETTPQTAAKSASKAASARHKAEQDEGEELLSRARH